MSPPDKDQVQAAIQEFLRLQYDKKAEPILKKLDNTEDSGEQVRLSEELEAFRQKYLAKNWIADAAERMASQLSFGTHISKGIHSSSKGSSVVFNQSSTLPAGVFGSQQLKSSLLDATGNAAALPLAGFFNQPVQGSQLKLRDIITEYPELVRDQLSSDPSASNRYFEVFKAKLGAALDQPINDELNKQMLWPVDPKHTTGAYVCITPLYPSVLAYETYQRISSLRYSEANKQARDDRFKKTVEHQSYVSLPDMAFVRLGGTKSQTVGQLNNQQGGRNMLLPSLPPRFNYSGFKISPKASSVFAKNFTYLCREPLERLYTVIKTDQNLVATREARKSAINELIEEILQYLSHFKQNQPAGWSQGFALHLSEKLWLDPQRAELTGEEDFARDRAKDWISDLAGRFAKWLDDHLRAKFASASTGFAAPEVAEWAAHFEEAIKRDQRLKTGVFS